MAETKYGKYIISKPRDKDIEQWKNLRNRLHSERDRRIDSALNKLELNLMAQIVLGFNYPVYQSPQSGDEQK